MKSAHGVHMTPHQMEKMLRKYSLNQNIDTSKTGEFGHGVGSKFEEYAHGKLQDCFAKDAPQIKIYWPHKFLTSLYTQHTDQQRSSSILNDAWWPALLLNQNPQLKKYQKTQNMGADLMCYYGNADFTDIDEVILLNIKSRNMARRGRHPNIISAYRLLQYFAHVREHKFQQAFLNKMEYWVVGFDHKNQKITNVYVRDLFKLDTSKMPRINFDAAMQIQWHLDHMITLPQQTKIEFIRKFTQKFNDDWLHHTRTRTRNINKNTKAIHDSPY